MALDTDFLFQQLTGCHAGGGPEGCDSVDADVGTGKILVHGAHEAEHGVLGYG